MADFPDPRLRGRWKCLGISGLGGFGNSKAFPDPQGKKAENGGRALLPRRPDLSLNKTQSNALRSGARSIAPRDGHGITYTFLLFASFEGFLKILIPVAADVRRLIPFGRNRGKERRFILVTSAAPKRSISQTRSSFPFLPFLIPSNTSKDRSCRAMLCAPERGALLRERAVPRLILKVASTCSQPLAAHRERFCGARLLLPAGPSPRDPAAG